MPSRTGKVEGILMKKILILAVPFMLAGCSYYNQFVERMNTDTVYKRDRIVLENCQLQTAKR